MKYVLTLLGVLFITLSLHAQKLHVLFVVENADPNFGLLQLRNEADMLQILDITAWGLGYTMEVAYLSKQKFTATDLQQAIESLSTGAKDIVVVYYAGFGLPPSNNKGFFANWKLRDSLTKGLSVDEVAGWLETKQKAQKLHLGLIVSEYSAQSIHSTQRVSDTLGTSMAYRQQAVQKLFLGQCGIVKMGSSLPYEPSWVNKNHSASLFTESLVRAFERMLMPPDSSALKQVSFQQFHAYSSSYLNRFFNGIPISQTPVLEIKSCKDSTFSTGAASIPDSLAVPIEMVGGLLNWLKTKIRSNATKSSNSLPLILPPTLPSGSFDCMV